MIKPQRSMQTSPHHHTCGLRKDDRELQVLEKSAGPIGRKRKLLARKILWRAVEGFLEAAVEIGDVVEPRRIGDVGDGAAVGAAVLLDETVAGQPQPAIPDEAGDGGAYGAKVFLQRAQGDAEPRGEPLRGQPFGGEVLV